MRTHRLLVALATPILVLPLLVAAGPPPHSQSVTMLRLNTFTRDAATLAARAQGFLAAEGLDVETTITPNSTVQMRGLGDGTWDLPTRLRQRAGAWSGREEGAEFVPSRRQYAGVSLPDYVRPEIHDSGGPAWSPSPWMPWDPPPYALVCGRVLEHGSRPGARRLRVAVTARRPTQPRLDSMGRGETFAGSSAPLRCGR